MQEMKASLFAAVMTRWAYMRTDDRGQGTFGYVLLVVGILGLVVGFIAAVNGWFNGKAAEINGF